MAYEILRRCRLALTAVLFGAVLGGCGSNDDGNAPLLPPGGPFSAVRFVTNVEDAGPGSLRQVVADAPEGAGIFFDPTLPRGTVTLTAAIPVTRSFTLDGSSGDGGRFEIDGDQQDRIFDLNAAFPDEVFRLELRDLVLSNGAALEGGAIDGRVTELVLRRVRVFDCDGSLGDGPGGVCEFTGDLLLAIDCAFHDNLARVGGAFTLNNSTALFERCSFYRNEANDGPGGALHLLRSYAIFRSCTFLENTAVEPAVGRGGAVSLRSSPDTEARATFYGSTVVGNEATLGGAVFLRTDSGGRVTVEFFASIVADNLGGLNPEVYIDGANGFVTGTHNVIGAATDADLQDGVGQNRSGTLLVPLDPLLGPPSFDLGGRAYRVPQPGSPAVGIWTAPLSSALPKQDQRGRPRPLGGAYDAGAIER